MSARIGANIEPFYNTMFLQSPSEGLGITQQFKLEKLHFGFFPSIDHILVRPKVVAQVLLES